MKKILNVIFALAFFLVLSIPLLTSEFGKGVVSEIDNEYLPELDNLSAENFNISITNYFDKRIGFRSEALTLYQQLNARLFNVLEHPTYMYGEDGHVFFKGEKFVKNYQHLNLNKEDAENFALALSGFQTYAESKGIDFLYFYIPDKETIYPEYYPKGINVYGDVSRTDLILDALESNNVNYFFAKDVMTEYKELMPVNNKEYDVGHWNEHGAFVSIRQLQSLLKKNHPAITPIEADDYDITYTVRTSLPVSHFEIYEETPVYTLKNNTSENKYSDLWSKVNIYEPSQYVCHYSNPACDDKPKLLIFGDSYLAAYDHFFINNFKEYTYIHRYNIYNQEFFEYYLTALSPDIVIFENPERSHIIDLYKDKTIS